MFRDYNIDPDDSGFFVNGYELYAFDLSTENGITTLDNPEDYPAYKFFVRVGGGYRAYKKKVNANRFYKQD